jgi:hypothetical protein
MEGGVHEKGKKSHHPSKKAKSNWGHRIPLSACLQVT